MPREQARTRLSIADACDALGDPESAEMERRAANSTSESLVSKRASPLGGAVIAATKSGKPAGA